MIASAEDPRSIMEIMTAVMDEIGAIGKNRDNAAQHFKFRGIDDVMNALNPALRKHGLVITAEIQERLAEVRVTKDGANMNVVHIRVRYTFHGPTGDLLETEAWGEAQDSGDKATSKAQSMAFKTAMLQTFCIATQDLEDADATSAEASVGGAPVQSRPAVAHGDRQVAGGPERSLAGPATEPQIGSIIRMAYKARGWSEKQTRDAIRSQTGKELEAISKQQASGLIDKLKGELDAPTPA